MRWSIIVMIHPEDVLENGVASALIVTSTAPYALLKLEEGARDPIVDDHYRYESILVLQNNQRPIFD